MPQCSLAAKEAANKGGRGKFSVVAGRGGKEGKKQGQKGLNARMGRVWP